MSQTLGPSQEFLHLLCEVVVSDRHLGEVKCFGRETTVTLRLWRRCGTTERSGLKLDHKAWIKGAEMQHMSLTGPELDP